MVLGKEKSTCSVRGVKRSDRASARFLLLRQNGSVRYIVFC